MEHEKETRSACASVSPKTTKDQIPSVTDIQWVKQASIKLAYQDQTKHQTKEKQWAGC